ncbi:MAG: glycosyltransferase family 39 protein [Verrucomicrobiota bacterium]
MAKALDKVFPAWLRGSLRNRAWIFVALAILLSVVVRVRLRDMPLERDEGEYAYAGQLLLQGVPPYKDAYNMKLPGTYVSYALIMAVFGQTPSGIHLGLALVNAATIWLMYLLGRRLLDEAAGATAAVAYALMSLSPNVLGLAGHATHFVVLPALGGMLLLLRAFDPPRRGSEPGPDSKRRTSDFRLLAASGLLFGLAFVMKQHGIFFGFFGGLFLVWLRFESRLLGPPDGGLGTRRFPRRRAGEAFRVDWLDLGRELAWFGGGFALPYLLTCLWLWAAGVFPQFWFWTVTYGSKYASGIPLVKASDVTGVMLRAIIGPNIVFWLLPWVGALMMWWDEQLDGRRRFLLTSLFLCSVASISIGFYFREHYFIQLLPVLALLIAVAVSRSLRLLRGDQSIELFLALAVLVVSVVAAGAVLIGNGAVWFALSPRKAVEEIYASTVFGDTRDAAEFIKANTTPDARIAVIGSEPEIYFYARRRSATGHIYTYALMERQPHALAMQEEFIREIEAARPEYVVYLNNQLSWLTQPDSERKIVDWWPKYWADHLELLRTVTTRQGAEELAERNPAPAGSSGNYLVIFKRKN